MICSAISPITLLMPPRPRTVSPYDSDINSSRTARLLSLSSTRAGQAPSSCATLFPLLAAFVLCLRPYSRSYIATAVSINATIVHMLTILFVVLFIAVFPARLPVPIYMLCVVFLVFGTRMKCHEN